MGCNFTIEDVNRPLNIKVKNDGCCSSFCEVTVSRNLVMDYMMIFIQQDHEQ